ncbi:MAG: MiaB/RimO family radical SAM methylthiotransferase [Candidatus Omnitrophota bacterium]
MRAKDKYKIGVLSLGCPRNLVDSENILGRLSLKGHRIVDIDKADAAIVNTCAFIEDARGESIDAILDLIDLKKRGKLKKIIVYGCLSQRYKDKLQKSLPEVDAFVGKVSLNHSPANFQLTPGHYTYLKICEGCVNNCSYCIIPRIKGRFVSLDVDSILRKIEGFNKGRISEVNIVGQDITGYGVDLGPTPRLPGLLKKIIRKGPDIGWIRLLYLYPSRIGDELLGLIKDEPKICKYIDLPLQHINDRILNLMNRQAKRADILRLIDKIRKKIPHVAMRTSLIVGFPSETDKDFKELLDFIEDVKFERLGAFTYSREEGTRAYSLKNQVPDRVKRERFQALMLRQQEISREVNRNFLGKVIDVLIEEKGKDYYLGRSQYDAPEVDGLVYVNSDNALRPGEFVKAQITDTLEYDLVGKALP